MMGTSVFRSHLWSLSHLGAKTGIWRRPVGLEPRLPPPRRQSVSAISQPPPFVYRVRCECPGPAARGGWHTASSSHPVWRRSFGGNLLLERNKIFMNDRQGFLITVGIKAQTPMKHDSEYLWEETFWGRQGGGGANLGPLCFWDGSHFRPQCS